MTRPEPQTPDGSAGLREILDSRSRGDFSPILPKVRVLLDAMTPGRWWRVLSADGELWCETSDEDEAREAMRSGDRLQRIYETRLDEWRDMPLTTPPEVRNADEPQ